MRDFEPLRTASGPRGRRRRRHARPETRPPRHRHPTAGVQHQKTIKSTNEAVIRLDLEKKQAVRKADREHRTMLQYKTLLAESKTPLLLAQKEIASLQKELDAFRKAVDAKAKERDAMERAAKFAQAETEKVLERRPCAIAATARRRDSSGTAGRPEPARNRKTNDPRPPLPEPTRPVVPRRPATAFIDAGRAADRGHGNAREGTGKNCVFAGGRDGDLQGRDGEAAQADLPVGEGAGKVRRRGGRAAEPVRSPRLETLYQRTQKLTEDLEEQITKNQQQHLEGALAASCGVFPSLLGLVSMREGAGCFFERFRAASDRVGAARPPSTSSCSP